LINHQRSRIGVDAGVVEGCDFLADLTLLITKSKDRSLRQRLQGLSLAYLQGTKKRQTGWRF
jgi:hypothetical protein